LIENIKLLRPCSKKYYLQSYISISCFTTISN